MDNERIKDLGAAVFAILVTGITTFCMWPFALHAEPMPKSLENLCKEK